VPPQKTNQLFAGAARVDITPPVGADLTGFGARLSASTGVHDPLYARAIALRQGAAESIVINCDLLGLDAAFVAVARRAIESATGVPCAKILIACTHTHSGAASMYLRYCGDVDAGYMAGVLERIAEVAAVAHGALEPATVASGVTTVGDVSVNRRIEGGPIDDELDVVRFDDEQGNAIAVITCFACHPIAAGSPNRLVSADFPGVLTQRLEAATGAVALFVNGASAQINPLLPTTALDASSGDFGWVERIGTRLADAALELWPRLKRSRRVALKTHSRELDLPLQRVDLNELEAAHRESAKTLAASLKRLPDHEAYLEFKWATMVLEWAAETRDAVQCGGVPKSIAAEVQTIELGDVVLVAIPGEFFLEYGQQIKRALAPRRAIVSTYTNGNFGYFPTRKAFTEGGYETLAYRFYGYPAAFSPAAGEKMVAAVKALHPPKPKGAK